MNKNGSMPGFRTLSQEELLKKLRCPNRKVDVVLDTDTFNEIDDQFALSYMVLSPEKLNVRAIYAAPFFNDKSSGPADGMEKSYEEILKLLTLLGREDLKPLVYRGSETYLPDEGTPVDSDAARDLAERAMTYPEDSPLYVVGIGAITNVASAILMNPEIIRHIVLVWLGGHAHEWPNTQEFNMTQDIAAARVVFCSGLPLVQLPCMGVVSSVTTTGPELTYHLSEKNALCDYLVRNTVTEAVKYNKLPTWSRVIWDITAVGWLIGGMEQDCIKAAPVPEYDDRYSFCATNHFMCYVYHVDRDAIFADLFSKLAKA